MMIYKEYRGASKKQGINGERRRCEKYCISHCDCPYHDCML
jgi:hypothetical protein